MNLKKEIYYWGPFIDKVATIKAMINSSKSINKYSLKFKSTLVDATGEWKNYFDKTNYENLKFVDLNLNFYNTLKGQSFLKSRLSYIKIFYKCFFPLKNLLIKNKPDYLIIHLIVSLPMVLFLFFNFQTKLCLRISGKPKLNFFRKTLWKVSSHKIHKIFCPTIETKEYLINQNIFIKNIFVLEDPVIEAKKINILKKEKSHLIKKNNIILIGRHTKQKNFQLFVEAFSKIQSKYPDFTVNIFGEGELKSSLFNLIKSKNLDNVIMLHGYKKNIFKYLSNSKFFVLTSLWEDPGFVLMESAYCNVNIISSDCPNGPRNFLLNGKAGFLFKNNSVNSLIETLEKAINCKHEELQQKKYLAKKETLKYSIFRHYKNIEKKLEI